MTVKVAPLVTTELRLHRRHHVVAATLLLTAMWIPVLLLVPPRWRADVLAWLLLLDLGALGLYFAPALAVVERGNGVTSALALTRLTPLRASLVRIAMLAVWALIAACVLVAVTGVPSWPIVLTGVALTSVLFSLLALAAVGRAATLTTYLGRVPFVAAPLLVPVMLRASGLWDHPVLALSPATGALELLAGRWSPAHAAWLAITTGALTIVVTRIGFDVRPSRVRHAEGRRRSLRAFSGVRWWRASRSFAAADGRTIAGDGLLLLVLAGVPLIAVALRVAAGPGVDWMDDRHGIDVSAHLPVMWAFVLVLHIPVMTGSLTGLLFLEDRDAGLLPALTTTRSSLATLLGYRLTTTVGVAAVFVGAGMWIAGARHPLGGLGVLLTVVAGAAVSVVPAMLLVSLVRDRVQGMAMMKAMGLPLYAPIAWWYVEAPAGWLLALVPTAWSARTFWATSVPEAVMFTAGALATSAAVAALLARRLRRSIT